MNNTEKKHYLFSWIALIWPWVTILLIFINIALSPWFSWYKNALSDLGVHQLGFIFNFAIFSEGIVNGFYFLFYEERSNWKYLIVVGSFSLSLVGVFNENFHLIHLILALIYFLLLPIYIIMSSRFNKYLNRYFNLAIGTSSLIVILIGILSIFRIFPKPVGLGVYEMAEAILISLWISIYILKEKLGLFD